MRLRLISWTPSQSFIILCPKKKASPRQTVKMRSLFESETLWPELSGKSCILQHLRVTCCRYVCGNNFTWRKSSSARFFQVQRRFLLVHQDQGTYYAKIVSKLQVLRFAKLFPKLCLSDEGLTTVCLQLRKVRRNSVSLLALVFFMLTDFPRSLPTACRCTFQTRWKNVERREHIRRWVSLRRSRDTIWKGRPARDSPLFICSCLEDLFSHKSNWPPIHINHFRTPRQWQWHY